ncbi:hypothetical protein SRHO_G00194590 [Serrasalmus rhombeus]
MKCSMRRGHGWIYEGSYWLALVSPLAQVLSHRIRVTALWPRRGHTTVLTVIWTVDILKPMLWRDTHLKDFVQVVWVTGMADLRRGRGLCGSCCNVMQKGL